MLKSDAIVPGYLQKHNELAREALFLSLGVVMLALLAQIAIPLPWTPVPITGQTFGVALMALVWGSKRGGLVFLSYILVGSLGLPVFAGGVAGFLVGPTMGYLVGMALATYVVGYLADRGATRSFLGSLGAAYLGSLCIFSLGLLNLSFYVPGEALLAAGLFPFLIGDLVKNTTAALIASRLRKSL